MNNRYTNLYRTRLFCVLLAVAMLCSPFASATPIFQARAGVAGQDSVSNTGGSGASAGTSHSRDLEEGISSGSAFAYVDTGAMGVRARASIQPVEFEHFGELVFGRLSSSAGGSAFVRYFDIMFTGESGEEGEIAVSTRLSLDGVLSVGNTPGLSSAGISVDYGLGVPGPGSTAITNNIGRVNRGYNSTEYTASTTGIFAAQIDDSDNGFDSFFDTPIFNIPLNTMVSLAIELSAGASVTTQDGDSVAAMSDFSQTLLLGYNDLVFNLPSGYTANSSSLGITNNQFTSTQPSTPVPAPASALLLIIGLFGLIRTHRKIGNNLAQRQI